MRVKAIDPQASFAREGLREEVTALVDALPDDRMRYIIRERF